MNGPDCPDDARLAQLAADTLPADERAALSAHVAQCPNCQGRAVTLPGTPADAASQRKTAELSGGNAPLPRGTLVGRYVILQLLGAGAMGLVYEAVDPDLERKVALKLLRTARADAEGRTRLLREAQAMARLSHPNVVPVFDVGTTEAGDIFVAMERVDGETLSEWCARQRDWRQRLRYFLYAGRGLAAAHAAGLVHRDFKPHNVLVGKDGRVRVTDFGLVRLHPDLREVPKRETLPPALLGEPLTRDGAIVGTPHYMSPEQLSSERVDARSDQFSFCVALYEALYGERPFGGERLHEILALQKLEQVREPPAGTRVPGWLRKALLRGLRADPGARYPSMEALFAALEQDPARLWRRVAVGVSVSLAVVVLAAVGFHRPSACAGVGDEVRRTWSERARAAVQAAYHRTGKSFAVDAFHALDAALSGYVARSADAELQTCRASRIEHTVPPGTYAQHADCFAQRQRELSAFVGLLATAAPNVLAGASRSVGALPPFSDCTRPGALASHTAPEEALYPAEAGALADALSQADAQRALGDFAGALTRLASAEKAAPHLGKSPLGARLQVIRGLAADDVNRFAEASAAFESAALLSERYGDDARAADAWLGRAKIEIELEHLKDAHRYLDLARAKLDRLPAPPVKLDYEWRSASALLAHREGRYADAITRVTGALSELGPKLVPEENATLYNQRADAEKALEQIPAAAADYLQALKLLERTLGPKHPSLAMLLGSLAVIRHRQQQDEQARALYRRAIDIDAEAFGPDNLDSAFLLNNLALLESDEGHEEQALSLLRQARAIKERYYGADHPSVALSWVNEANSLVSLHRLPEAETALQNALRILIARKGPDHPQLVAVYNNLGTVQRDQNRFREAEPSFEAAVTLAEKRLGPEHPWLAMSLYGLGQNDVSLHRYRKAVPELERALAIDTAIHATATDIAEVQFGLAMALWPEPGQRLRAVQLASESLAVARKTPLPDGPPVAEMEGWLREHRAVRNAPRR